MGPYFFHRYAIVSSHLSSVSYHNDSTGSVSVGKVVYEAAAKNLTPVTLELGGKNPCIVDRSANIDLSAKRIAWGALFNCGQTCIRPDWLLVHKDIEEQFTQALIKYIKQFYGDDPKVPVSWQSFTRQILTVFNSLKEITILWSNNLCTSR
mgnify:CR=1 FL=1